MDRPEQILGDITVLDLSQGLAGPFCAKLLAGLGAEVIKIEQPETGDASRQAKPFIGDRQDVESSPLFAYLNTSKKSVTLDLDAPRQAQAIKQLAQTCDIFIESFTPGHLKSPGLSFDELSDSNPGPPSLRSDNGDRTATTKDRISLPRRLAH